MVFGEEQSPGGFAVPMHVHEADDELFYVLDGELAVLSLEGKRESVAATA